ncbi:MAG: solute carrier family 23 protein, partial [[Clostridium] symbiosum]
MARFYNLCERRFQLGQNKTSIRTEILAGVTTFATMSYVLATVPNMLSNAGLPKGAVLTVLIIMISVCSIAMALYTNRPFCLAPGMSSVAIVSSIFGEAGIPVEVAFGLIFLSGILFVIISFVGLRELVVKAIPASVKFSISAGIGLFIALMGLKTGDVVVAGNSNSLAFGNLNSPKVFLFVLGFVVLILLEVRKFRGSMIVSILVVTLLGIPLGITTVPETMINFPASVTEIVFRIDIRG